jgi:ketosteroid isomerase-like protein
VGFFVCGMMCRFGYQKANNMSKIINNTFSIFYISFFIISCETKTTFDIDKARSHIAQQNKKYMKFYNNGDASGVADLHVDDAIVMPPNIDLVKGKDAINKVISDEISAGATDLVFTTLDMYGDEDYVTEVGRYSLNVKDNGKIVMSDSGKYIVLWKQVSKNNWLMKADIWNSDLPIKQ